MKLIIQIPCYNEADTLKATIADLPRQIEGFDLVEILVVDDGSTDETVEVAKQAGANHLVCLAEHSGLAAAFSAGLDACLKAGADIIVNTDADNQYHADGIKALVQPLLHGQADLTVGDRGLAKTKKMKPLKLWLQKLGSWVVAQSSGLKIPDATSGFRAFTKDAALKTLVLSQYSYTLETLIQAGSHRMRVKFIPVKTNPQVRPSRLMKSIPDYIYNSFVTIVRVYTMYKPLRVFSIYSAILIFGGSILGLRYLYFYFNGQGGGHIQSVVLSAVLLIVGFQVFLIGLVADLIGSNRKILEDVLYRLKKLELSQPGENQSHTDP